MGHESIEVGPAVSPLKKKKKKWSGLENLRVHQTKAVSSVLWVHPGLARKMYLVCPKSLRNIFSNQSH